MSVLDASAPKGGDGGTIETSGDNVQIADGAIVTTKSASGANGNWTLDPDGFNIGYGGNISSAQLDLLLGYTNITIDSTYGRGVDGNVNVLTGLSWSANTTLTLNATNDININAPITATGASAGLDLNADKDINFNAAVTFTGANAALSMHYNGNYYINNIATASDGSLTIGNASVTLSGADASLTINGQAYTLIHHVPDVDLASHRLIAKEAAESVKDAPEDMLPDAPDDQN